MNAFRSLLLLALTSLCWQCQKPEQGTSPEDAVMTRLLLDGDWYFDENTLGIGAQSRARFFPFNNSTYPSQLIIDLVFPVNTELYEEVILNLEFWYVDQVGELSTDTTFTLFGIDGFGLRQMQAELIDHNGETHFCVLPRNQPVGTIHFTRLDYSDSFSANISFSAPVTRGPQPMPDFTVPTCEIRNMPIDWE